MLFNNNIRASINLVFRRFREKKHRYIRTWPNDWVPFHWSRPEKIPGYFDSGDLVGPREPAKDEIYSDFRNSQELKSLDPDHPLRKMFSVNHASSIKQSQAYSNMFIEKLGVIHAVDHCNSHEAKIAKLTHSLRNAQSVIRGQGGASKYNQTVRTLANSLNLRRYSNLTKLQELHKERYERIISLLQIEPRKNLINVPPQKPYRKNQMRSLAVKYAIEMKEKKVEEFIKLLDKEKADFEDYKRETLKWIEEKESQLGMTV